jgi:hypothetical protein
MLESKDRQQIIVASAALELEARIEESRRIIANVKSASKIA